MNKRTRKRSRLLDSKKKTSNKLKSKIITILYAVPSIVAIGDDNNDSPKTTRKQKSKSQAPAPLDPGFSVHPKNAQNVVGIDDCMSVSVRPCAKKGLGNLRGCVRTRVSIRFLSVSVDLFAKMCAGVLKSNRFFKKKIVCVHVIIF